MLNPFGPDRLIYNLAGRFFRARQMLSSIPVFHEHPLLRPGVSRGRGSQLSGDFNVRNSPPSVIFPCRRRYSDRRTPGSQPRAVSRRGVPPGQCRCMRHGAVDSRRDLKAAGTWRWRRSRADYNTSVRTDFDKALPNPYVVNQVWYTMPQGRFIAARAASRSIMTASRSGSRNGAAAPPTAKTAMSIPSFISARTAKS